MPEFSTEKRKADVLVIGSGAAGAMAAIKAAEKGARVILATKKALGASVTLVARGGFQAAFGYSNPEDCPEVHIKDTLAAGYQLNDRNLVDRMAHEIIGLVNEMESWGINLIRKNGKWDQKPMTGSSFPRHLHHYDTTGQALMKCLRDRVKRTNISIIPHVTLADLFLEEGRIAGAWGIRQQTGQFLILQAPTVILATGGAAQLYAVNDNPAMATGSGYAMGFQAGVELIDMEMIEFQPAVCHPPSLLRFAPNASAWIARGARLYNGRGERFARKFFPEKGERMTRALIARAIGIEIAEGRGTEHGGVYLDLSDFKAEELTNVGPAILKAFVKAGIDLHYQPMEITPSAHCFLGGIRIDENGQTKVPGLYAAGETAGGVHGANRLGGNSISAALVFGARAGTAAALFAKDTKVCEPSREGVEKAKKRILGLLHSPKGGVASKEVFKNIQEIMQKSAAMVRTESGLSKASKNLHQMVEELLPRLCVADDISRPMAEAARCLEVSNLALTAVLVVSAALRRQESRGFHYRADFPAQNDIQGTACILLSRGVGGQPEFGRLAR